MRTTFFSILISLLIIVPAAAQTVPLESVDDLTSYLSREDYKTLLEGGEVLRYLTHKEDLTLPPPAQRGEMEALRTGDGRSFGIESLHFLPVEKYTDEETLLLRIYNTLRQVHTLKGMDYYSASRGYRRTLFHQFFAIPSPDDKTPLTDPVHRKLPEIEEFYIFQEDSTFGKSVHRMKFKTDPEAITISLTNVDTLWYLFVPVASEGKLTMAAKVTPTREGILFYGICHVDSGGVPGMKEKTTNSLKNRVKALFEWFSLNSSGL